MLCSVLIGMPLIWLRSRRISDCIKKDVEYMWFNGDCRTAQLLHRLNVGVVWRRLNHAFPLERLDPILLENTLT